MAVTRVALQAALAQLAAGKIFADSNGLLISHAGVKVGSFTRDISLASGTQAITGIGFKPSAIIFLALKDGTSAMSIGLDDGTTRESLCDDTALAADTYTYNAGTYSINLQVASGTSLYIGNVQSFDSDGFTISWTKGGTPTGTANIMYLAFR